MENEDNKKPSKILSPYIGLGKLVAKYWRAYGGFGAIFLSPYVHISLLITIVSSGIWLHDKNWYDVPIGVLPNVIGFSLGGYAIWLALGDDKFRSAISGSKKGKTSPYSAVNATFVHFIALQIFALIWALVAKSSPIYNSPLWLQHYLLSKLPMLYDIAIYIGYIGAFLGYFFFIYAISSALAATLAIFRISGWLEQFEINKKTERLKQQQKDRGNSDDQHTRH